jgi:ubiquinone/menaquinone biosynthesis C-methylase UbiE
MSPTGIPLFAEHFCSEDAQRQREHYERIAPEYLSNLGYAHTQEYMRYLDGAFLDALKSDDLGCCAEICCGGAEAFQLLEPRIARGIGVDISLSMLESAKSKMSSGQFLFVQGDATALPIRNSVLDNVVIFGGIHHVNDREGLFREVFRVLKPGGSFYWREPVSDFMLWRFLRTIIYRMSPTLDHETEQPLLYRETRIPLENAGFELTHWRTCGFLGYCFLMNSDVLVFNRIFRFIPGVAMLTRFAAKWDDFMVRLPGMRRNGLIVVGSARKPDREATP